MKSIFSTLFIILFTCYSSLSLAGPSAKGWHTYSTDSFVIYSTKSEESVRDLLYELEVFRATVYESLQLNINKHVLPVRIFLLNDPADFAYFAGKLTSGYFQDTIYGPKMVIGPPKTSGNTILYHEYVHFLMRTTAAFRYPTWYNEGLAEYYSTLEIRGSDVIVGRATNRRVPAPSIDKVMNRTSTYDFTSGKKKSEFYASAWLLVNFFNLSAVNDFPNYRSSLASYLQAINQGAEHEAAFADSFGMEPDELRAQLKKYLRKDRVNLARLPLPEISLDVIKQPVSEGAITLEFAYLANPRSETGAELLAKAVELNDANAIAQKALQAEIDQSPDAQQWLDKAISSADTGANGLMSIANTYSALAKREPGNKQALLLEAKHYLDKALSAENLPAIHYFYPDILWELGLKQEAINQVEVSINTMPANLYYNLQVGEYMYKINNIPNSRYFLTNVVNWSESSRLAMRALEILDQLPDQ